MIRWKLRRLYRKQALAAQGIFAAQRIFLIATCILADLLVNIYYLVSADSEEGVNWSDQTSFHVGMIFLVMIGMWLLLPLAFHHSPKEFRLTNRSPGPPSSLLSSVIICLSFGVNPLSVTTLAVYISLVSRGSKRWTFAGSCAIIFSILATQLPSIITDNEPVFENPWISVAGYFIVSTVFILLGLAIGRFRFKKRLSQIKLVDQAEFNSNRLESEINQTRQEERNRIARDMHDSVSHHLSLISLYASALSYRDDLDRDQLQESVDTIQSEAQAAINDLRQIIHALRFDDDIDPRSSIEDLVAKAQALGTRVKVTYSKDADTSKLTTLSVHTLCRAIQEGLTNARRYAPSSPIFITVSTDQNQLKVTMMNKNARREDRTDPRPSISQGGGHGLLGIQERARMIGGAFEFSDGEEFSWTLWLPMEGK